MFLLPCCSGKDDGASKQVALKKRPICFALCSNQRRQSCRTVRFYSKRMILKILIVRLGEARNGSSGTIV
jgi:hypothetical protein